MYLVKMSFGVKSFGDFEKKLTQIMRCNNYCLHLYSILDNILAVWINTGVKLLTRLSDQPSYLLTKFGVYILSYDVTVTFYS